MVTRLVKFKRDPNGLGRGEGFYYLRGGKREGNFTLPSGNSVKGAYYSKYSTKRDKARLSTDWQVNRIGIPKKIAKVFAHIGDGKITNKKIRR